MEWDRIGRPGPAPGPAPGPGPGVNLRASKMNLPSFVKDMDRSHSFLYNTLRTSQPSSPPHFLFLVSLPSRRCVLCRS